ncbi:MAG: hypothetical protein ACRETQ_03975 [Gammaproteobacteria bacterium]
MCRQCRFYDPGKPQSCAEERADPPLNKQRANFCEYFEPRAGAYRPADTSAAERAHTKLDNLFNKKN